MQLALSFTVVVGPNGTGKSNLTDAVRWALQTGRLSDGRAERREEVLFAGTPQHRAAGLCEVRLTFDNQDRQLPLEASEVEIVRRLYRGGESEYRLQGAVCRARDIERLLAHLGLAEGYAWIGQGRVEEVIAQDPAARRRLLEDAAGASVYRERRREAVLELARADHEAEVERVRLEELLQKLPALRDDAERAKEAERLRQLIAELEIGLSRRRLERTLQSLERAHARALAAEEKRLGGARAGARLEEAMAALGVETGQIGQSLSHLEASLSAVEGRLQAAASQAAAATERERAALTRQEEARERLARREQSAQALQSAYATASLRLQEAEETLRRAGAQGADALRLLARRPQIEAALAANGPALATAEAAHSEAATRRAVLEGEAEAAAEAVRAQEAESALARKELDAARAAEARAREERDTADHRAALLQDAIRSAERQAPVAVRAVLREAEAGRLQGIRGMLGRLVRAARPEVQLALVTALGGQAHDVITDGEAQARAAIEFLRGAGAGRATFLPLGALNPAAAAEAPRLPGCVGVLSDLCSYPREVEDAVLLRLGRTLVAEDLAAAQRVAQATQRRLRVVSLDGQVVQPGGALTGGQALSLPAQSPSAAEWEAAQHELRRTDQELSQQSAALGRAIARERQAAHGRDEAQMTLERALSEARRAGQEEERLAAQRQIDVAERAQLLQELSQAQKAVGAVQTDALQEAALQQALQQEEARRLSVALGEAQEAKEEADAQLEMAVSLLRDAQAEAHGAQGRRAFTAQARERLHSLRQRGQRLEIAARSLERLLERSLRKVATEAAGAEEAALRLGEEVARLQAEGEQEERQLRESHGEGALARQLRPLPAGAEELLLSSRRSLQELGGAPPDAPDRLRQAEERLAQLSEHLSDLAAAKATLVEVLAAADQAVADRLRQAVSVVGRSFDEVVTALFGAGAHAGLVPVAQGIDIEVQLPGKEAVRLSWLSGGERALTAISFLFSLSALRPPPFYLLDEIEASLDERNVERFAQFLGRQPGRQLIVVTHQRPTMEAADQLIGTTMQERGVTRLAAVVLGEGGLDGDLGQVAQGS